MASKRPPGPSGKLPNGGAPSSECRVLLDGREEKVEDLAALVQMAQRGHLKADTRIRVPSCDGWVRAAEVAELSGVFVDDPWAAWEASETGPSESEELSELPRNAMAPAPEPVLDLPEDALRTVPEGRKQKGRFVIDGPRREKQKQGPTGAPPPKAADSVRPQATPRVAAAASSRGMDNVIAFPSPAGPSTLGPHALAPLRDEPLLDLPVLKVPTPTGPRTGPRWGILILVASGAFGLVGVVHAWVRHVAGQTFVPPVTEVAVAPKVDAPVEPPAAPAPDMAELDELTVLDQELRSRMRSEIGAVVEAGDLESALYVDLSRMGLSDLRVDAVVTSWSGKKSDVPRSAEVQVGFRSRAGELDRELAAVGLIVGRYIQSYGLDLARFEVLLDAGDAGVRRWPIDPAQSRNYYIQRVSLPDFLTNMRKHGGR